ncbi:MAG: outer membrane lipoprotein carrier protein LolA [Pyrinomonadaceae bacterium]|nr:outer membrane lipoprotein carrier protein LolA [Pyrinomonadaceae bacterium]
MSSCIFLSPTLTAAQANEANLLIQKIEARYGRMRGLAAEFEQVYTGPGGRVRRESGRLFLARPRKMRWEYPGKLFIVNGRDVWFYVMADREATHADTGSVSDERFPFLFLLGQTNLRRAFRSITIIDDGSAATDTRTLRLIPRSNSGDLRELFLNVTTDGRILKVKMLDASGSQSEISLGNVRENYVAPPEAFQFIPPSGVTVRKQK